MSEETSIKFFQRVLKDARGKATALEAGELNAAILSKLLNFKWKKECLLYSAGVASESTQKDGETDKWRDAFNTFKLRVYVKHAFGQKFSVVNVFITESGKVKEQNLTSTNDSATVKLDEIIRTGVRYERDGVVKEVDSLLLSNLLIFENDWFKGNK